MTEILRVAVRKFEPFERALQEQFAVFRTGSGVDAGIEIVSLDLNPLTETLSPRVGSGTDRGISRSSPTDRLPRRLPTGR